jgi:hypothetical protein
VPQKNDPLEADKRVKTYQFVQGSFVDFAKVALTKNLTNI